MTISFFANMDDNQFASPKELLENFLERIGIKKNESKYIDPEDVKKALLKDLETPTTWYKAEGWYAFQGTQHDFTSLFEIDCKGKLAGELTDFTSEVYRYSKFNHIICGRQIPVKDNPTLRLVKIPPAPYMNIYYFYIKDDSKKNLEGHYSGAWTFNRAEGFPVKTDWSGPELETNNKTEITLTLVK